MTPIITATAKATWAMTLAMIRLFAALSSAVTRFFWLRRPPDKAQTRVSSARLHGGHTWKRSRQCRARVHWEQTDSGIRGVLYPTITMSEQKKPWNRLAQLLLINPPRLMYSRPPPPVPGPARKRWTDEQKLIEDKDALPKLRMAESSTALLLPRAPRKRKLAPLQPLPCFSKRRIYDEKTKERSAAEEEEAETEKVKKVELRCPPPTVELPSEPFPDRSILLTQSDPCPLVVDRPIHRGYDDQKTMKKLGEPKGLRLAAEADEEEAEKDRAKEVELRCPPPTVELPSKLFLDRPNLLKPSDPRPLIVDCLTHRGYDEQKEMKKIGEPKGLHLAAEADEEEAETDRAKEVELRCPPPTVELPSKLYLDRSNLLKPSDPRPLIVDCLIHRGYDEQQEMKKLGEPKGLRLVAEADEEEAEKDRAKEVELRCPPPTVELPSKLYLDRPNLLKPSPSLSPVIHTHKDYQKMPKVIEAEAEIEKMVEIRRSPPAVDLLSSFLCDAPTLRTTSTHLLVLGKENLSRPAPGPWRTSRKPHTFSPYEVVHQEKWSQWSLELDHFLTATECRRQRRADAEYTKAHTTQRSVMPRTPLSLSLEHQIDPPKERGPNNAAATANRSPSSTLSTGTGEETDSPSQDHALIYQASEGETSVPHSPLEKDQGNPGSPAMALGSSTSRSPSVSPRIDQGVLPSSPSPSPTQRSLPPPLLPPSPAPSSPVILSRQQAPSASSSRTPSPRPLYLPPPPPVLHVVLPVAVPPMTPNRIDLLNDLEQRVKAVDERLEFLLAVQKRRQKPFDSHVLDVVTSIGRQKTSIQKLLVKAKVDDVDETRTKFDRVCRLLCANYAKLPW